MVLEIEIRKPNATECGLAHVQIDDTEYMVIAARGGWVTVVAGRQWIRSRRTLGKTFHNLSEIAAHYKRHGKTILEYAESLVRV